MEFGPLAILAILWWVLSLVGGKQRQRTSPPRPSNPRRREGWESQSPPPSRGGQDSTQREGSRLEQVLREFEAVLERAETPVTRPPSPTSSQRREREEGGLDSWEMATEGESLDSWEPEVVTLDVEVERPNRVVKTMDEEYAALEAKRLGYIESRNRPILPSDHVAFDKMIRSAPIPPRPNQKALRLGRADLKKAMIWREVLGPPNALK